MRNIIAFLKIITVLANICDANAVMLMKLHVDNNITMAKIRGLTRGCGCWGCGRVTDVFCGRRSSGINWHRCRRQTATITNEKLNYQIIITLRYMVKRECHTLIHCTPLVDFR